MKDLLEHLTWHEGELGRILESRESPMLTENEFGCFLQKEYIKYVRSLGFSFLVEIPERKFGF